MHIIHSYTCVFFLFHMCLPPSGLLVYSYTVKVKGWWHPLVGRACTVPIELEWHPESVYTLCTFFLQRNKKLSLKPQVVWQKNQPAPIFFNGFNCSKPFICQKGWCFPAPQISGCAASLSCTSLTNRTPFGVLYHWWDWTSYMQTLPRALEMLDIISQFSNKLEYKSWISKINRQWI